MVIHYYEKLVYGKPFLYIVDQNVAMYVNMLTHKTTLHESHKQALEGLGFTFVKVEEPR